jgi:hypothetical protein
MSSRGAFTLAEIAAKLTMLEVACSRCERRGRLSLARLIEQHGAEASLGDLREVTRRVARALPQHRYTTAAAFIIPALPAAFLVSRPSG